MGGNAQIEYIHYGSTVFLPGAVAPIRNTKMMPKPQGGLWGTRADSEFGWKEWCEEQGFRQCHEAQAFRFTLRPDARVLLITDADNLVDLPHVEGPLTTRWDCLDFEKLATEYDAIEVLITEDFRLNQRLYGWDCDSILIINPEVVVLTQRGEAL